jgi:hypothetical protein
MPGTECQAFSSIQFSSVQFHITTIMTLMVKTTVLNRFCSNFLDHPILGVHGAPARIHKRYKTITNTSDWSIGMIFFTELETPNYEKALCIHPLINRRRLQVIGHQNSIVSLHNKVS